MDERRGCYTPETAQKAMAAFKSGELIKLDRVGNEYTAFKDMIHESTACCVCSVIHKDVSSIFYGMYKSGTDRRIPRFDIYQKLAA